MIRAGGVSMMIFIIRILMFAILPLLLGGAVVLVDRTASSPERKLEVFLVFLFALGVAGSGIGNFFGHLFLSDLVAESIGWSTGSPFQLEMGFANLAVGVLGIIAVSRRDGFREATVIAVTILAVGATVVHIMDIIESGNFAPGNSLQNVINLLKPTLLILFLAASRRAEARPDADVHPVEFDQWRAPLGGAAGFVTAIIATAFGLGYAIDQPGLVTLIGILLSFVVLFVVLQRSPLHIMMWREERDRAS
jgi:4-amino-4-deoxy-L-arabinose transferase-like glycosyltransferase